MITRLPALAAATLCCGAIACTPAAGNMEDAAQRDAAAEGEAAAQGSAGGSLSGPTPDTLPVPDGFVAVDLATVGMDVTAQAPVVLLRQPETGRIVPIWVGIAEAHAILRVLLAMDVPRPMTHDLLAAVVGELDATVESVQVHELRGSTFIGRVRLLVDGEPGPRDVDSRPSDALALAMRTGSPIHVAESLLDDPPDFDFLAPEAAEQVVRILGLTVVSPTARLRERHALPDRTGVVVVGASAEGARGGLARGDLIVDVNGESPTDPIAFLDAVLSAVAVVRITYLRDGVEHQVDLEPVPAHPGLETRRLEGRIQT